MGKHLAILLALLLGWQAEVYAGALRPDASANEWLNQMINAVQKLSYHGRSVFTNGSQMISLEVKHAVFDGEPWERVVHLSGEPAEILRRGGTVNCLHPDSTMDFKIAPLGKVASNIFQRHDFKLPEQYGLAKGGRGRIAGRYAHMLAVTPVDRMRYGYRLWLDDETGMLLKSIVIDPQGKPLEVLEFVDIHINVPLAKEAFAPGDGLHWVARKESGESALASPTQWILGWLPKGFALARGELKQVGEARVSSKVYSDGLAAFTVFIEPYNADKHQEGTQIRGATVAVSRSHKSSKGQKLVTVVGEVPMETALQVVSALQIR